MLYSSHSRREKVSSFLFGLVVIVAVFSVLLLGFALSAETAHAQLIDFPGSDIRSPRAPSFPNSPAPIGYGGPNVSKGLHPSGYTDNLVYNVADLEKLNPKTDGVRMGHAVGTKKRKEIMTKALEKKFKVFNARVTASGSKS